MNKIKKKIIFLVNIDSFFVSHRIQIAEKMIKCGYEVHIATEFTTYKKTLIRKGFKTHDITFNRNSLNFFKAFLCIVQIFFLIIKIKPNILHAISLKPSIFGGLVSFVSPVKSIVISITGLGSMFLSDQFFSKLRQKVFAFLLKMIFLHKNLIVILQNKSDLNYLVKNSKLRKDKVKIIKGSGVNLKKFKFSKLSKKIPNIVMISRIIADKGILEFIRSIEYLKKNNFKGKFYLVGDIDFSNPSAIKKSQLDTWKHKRIINHLPYKSNINNVLKKSTIVILPSYREGFPKILMEAAASGRPSITTNVPGCRDAVINNVTGVLVPPKNYIKLANAINALSKNKKLLQKIGYDARKHAIKNFDVTTVVSKHLSIYNLFD